MLTIDYRAVACDDPKCPFHKLQYQGPVRREAVFTHPYGVANTIKVPVRERSMRRA